LLLRDYAARFDAAANKLGLDPGAPLEWWEKGEVVRASLPDVLVELGFLWIREGDFDRWLLVKKTPTLVSRYKLQCWGEFQQHGLQ